MRFSLIFTSCRQSSVIGCFSSKLEALAYVYKTWTDNQTTDNAFKNAWEAQDIKRCEFICNKWGLKIQDAYFMDQP